MPETKTFKQDLQILKDLQVLDKQIYDFSQDLLQIPIQIKAYEQEFDNAKKASQALEEKLKQAKLKQKEKELDLGQKEDQILKRQGQLNLVKTNEEYSAIRMEIANMKADNSVLEEAILLLMDEVETETKQVNAGKESLTLEEKKLADRKAELAAKEKVCRAGVEEFKVKRKDFINQVSTETASFYERILAKKSGVALARIDSENCSSCQMKLRAQVLNEVKLQEKIVLCENCTRILYEEA